MQELAARQGVDYVPYWIAHDLYTEYRQPIREHWQPYLNGGVEMEQAALGLIRALRSN